MVGISKLSDDVLSPILEQVMIEPADRKRVSQVCKQWLRVEGQTRRSLTLLKLSYLRQVLPRFPNLITFQTSQPFSKEEDLKFLAETCPKLEVINLYTTGSWSLPMTGLSGLSTGGGVSKLSKLSISGRVNVGIEKWLHMLAPENLTYLDVGRCRLVDDKAAEAIGLLCTRLSYLNVENSHVSNNGLRFLAHGRCSRTLKTLVLARCFRITDSGVSHLQNMHHLEELDLRECWVRQDLRDDPLNSAIGRLLNSINQINRDGISGLIAAISANPSIKKLNLSWLKNVSDRSLIFIAQNCPNLEIIDLSGCNVTSTGIRAFSGHRCLETLVLRSRPLEFSWSDVERLVLRCHSIKSVFLSNKIKQPIPASVSEFVTLVDEW